MNKENLERFRKILEETRRNIVKELDDTNESVRDMINDNHNSVNDSIDEATSNTTQRILSQLSNISQHTIIAIDTALRKIDENTFGICISCGKSIDIERLNSIPWTTKCINCKNIEERKR